MPKSSPQKLAYQKKYNAEHVEEQSARKQARRVAIREGRAKVGDGKDVDHVVPLARGGSVDGKTRVVTQETNRGWRKGKSGYNP